VVVLEVAVALAFLFAVFALLASMIAEAIASFFALRASFLLRGLRSLFDGDASAADPVMTNWLFAQCLVSNQGVKGQLPVVAGRVSRATLREMPSYMAGRSVARSVLATLVPAADAPPPLAAYRRSAEQLPEGPFRDSMLALVANADGQVTELRHEIETWYDDHMKRVSGWYKRRLRKIVFVIGLGLVLVFNANAVDITRALFTDPELRERAVAIAEQAAGCPSDGDEEGGVEGDGDSAVDTGAADCIARVRGDLSALGAAGVPLFWTVDPYCQVEGNSCEWHEKLRLTDPTSEDVWVDLGRVGMVLLGWLAFALALLPGASFWFDLLGRIGGIRSSGPKPATADDS
jgi:hypothetical protein